MFLVSERAKADVRIENTDGKTASQILIARAKQAGKQKECEGAIQILTNLQNSASSANSNQRDFQILDAENDKKLTLESFEIIEKLGKGSFGSVFLVRKKDDPEKKNYAMKVLEKDKVLAQNLIRYAKTERNVLCLAKHQFIVGLEFAFQTTSRLYLIMEYCPGGDMGQALAKHRRFELDLARIYAAEIVLAIEYLHKNEIIFRDLKPDNVVFDEDGHALLTDFGLSKTGMGASSVSNSFCGSVAYLAPEMLRRAGHTKSIDWYLLGVLIYEMLVGVPPYFNPDKAILFKNIE